MGIEIKGDNNGIAVEGTVTIGELNFEFGKGITSMKGVKVPAIEDAVVIEEPQPQWEEVIPAYLRTGKLMKAWSELRKAGVLKEDYQMTERKAAVAYRLVEAFNQARKEILGKKCKGTWKPFEDFWGFGSLQNRGGSIAKELEMTISKIFREL